MLPPRDSKLLDKLSQGKVEAGVVIYDVTEPPNQHWITRPSTFLYDQWINMSLSNLSHHSSGFLLHVTEHISNLYMLRDNSS